MATTSHWQADAGDAPFPALRRAQGKLSDLPATCDVAVVGGGIAGVSTAFWLRKLDSSLNVVVIERDRLASGASGRNAGFLLQGTDADFARTVAERGADPARRLWRFTQENRDGIIEALDGEDVWLDARGSLIVAADPEEDERVRTAAELLQRDGIAATYRPPDATSEHLGSRGFLGSLEVGSGASLHPVRVVRALASQSGTQVIEGTAVRGLEASGERVRVETERGAVEAERVVLALNAYLPQLVPALGGIVRPVRAQMLATSPRPRKIFQPVYSHEGYFYLRQLPSGEVLLGGARHLHLEDEVGYDDAPTEVLQADLEAYLETHFPDFAGAEVVRRWSGTMGFSADGLPAFGPVPGVGGAWWVGGFTGHGMGYGFRMGRTVAASVLGEHDDYADLFDAARFETLR